MTVHWYAISEKPRLLYTPISAQFPWKYTVGGHYYWFSHHSPVGRCICPFLHFQKGALPSKARSWKSQVSRRPAKLAAWTWILRCGASIPDSFLPQIKVIVEACGVHKLPVHIFRYSTPAQSPFPSSLIHFSMQVAWWRHHTGPVMLWSMRNRSLEKLWSFHRKPLYQGDNAVSEWVDRNRALLLYNRECLNSWP